MQTNRVKILGTHLTYCVRVENGVAEIRPETWDAREPMLLIEVEPAVWGEVILGLTSLADAYRAGRLETTGDPRDLAELSRALSTGLEASSRSGGDSSVRPRPGI